MTEENTGNNTETKVENNEQTPVDEPKKTESMIPKTRFDQVVSQKNELNDTLTGLVDELKSDIPEEYQDLIPDTKPADQIKWIRNAMKKGIFHKEVKSPDSQTPSKSKQQIDTSNMGTLGLLSHGFKK